MKQILYLLIFVFALFNSQANAQTMVNDADLDGTSDVTWTLAGSPYMLNGLVFLEDGGKLTIEAGVVVKGAEVPTSGDDASALIITRGAQIFANGTANAPIIFTAEADDTNDPDDLTANDRGLWGGLIILGNGNISDDACPQSIEGLPVGDDRALYGDCTNPVEDENSGVLRFVSIRHGGVALSPGNEINGLTLGGVGSGTTIEFIEVIANFDDGIEFFGGTAQVKNASVSFCGDDAIDYDTGWRGRGQFMFVLIGDDEGDNGGEHDGAIPDGNTPFSQPTILNATYIGSSASSRGLRMRDATGGTYANSIFTKFSTGIEIEQNDGQPVDCLDRIANGELEILNNVFWDNGTYIGSTGTDITTVPDYMAANGNTDMMDPGLASISYSGNGMLDPRPTVGGPAYQDLAENPDQDFFVSVPFKGAFGGGLWLRGWTALDEYGFLPAQEEVVITDDDLTGTSNVTWTSDNTYLLDGLVFLETGGKLTIEPGTVIKAAEVPTNGSDIASALIITRGAQICADGTPQQPIIFTAEADDTSDPADLLPNDRGFWGGLIILGNGNIADDACPQSIEGLPVGDDRALYGNCTNPIENESSGSLKYVSIRHGGTALAPGNEINGLTLGAVGSGTVLENIEIIANLDDGIEFFGGSVSVKGLCVSYCGDDAVDYDTGWRGKGQYFFVLVGDDEGDNGGEHDGAIPDGNTPFSSPTIYNATYIGSSASSRGIRMRDATGGTYANSIITGFSTGIEIEQNDGQPVDCLDRIDNGELNILNNIFWNNDSYIGFTGSDMATVTNHLSSNGNSDSMDPGIGGISYTTDGGLDPRAFTSGDDTADPPAGDDFFDPVNFKGAFCGAGVWISGWTALSEYGVLDNSIPSQYLDEVNPACLKGELIIVRDADLTETSDVTWTANNTYLLDGFVFLEAGGKLTIEAGTVIKGAESPSTGDLASTLIIARGAQICANGTSAAPVIFTAEIDDIADNTDLAPTDRGLWGGLIILGNGNIADDACPQSIEGLPVGDDRSLYGDCVNPDENESSGTLTYVSIRHGGAALAPGNEINGLTLGAVGSGTTLENIEIIANFDDGIEFFGGTAQVKGLCVSFCGDDAVDYDTGWRGKGQFFFVLVGDDEGDNGGEHDGAIPDGNTPFSAPTIYNATYIGSNASSRGLRMRDATGGIYANSIFTEFSTGIEIEQNDGQPVDCLDRIDNGELQILNNIFWNNGTYVGLTGSDMTTVPDHLVANSNTSDFDPGITGISYTTDGGLDPAATNDQGQAALAELPAGDDFFTPVDFKGAFCSVGSWIQGWTALATYGLLDSGISSWYLEDLDAGDGCFFVGTDFVIEEKGYRLAQNYPNPANGITTFNFTLPKSTVVSLEVYDMFGRLVTTVMDNQQMTAGDHYFDFDTSDMPVGNYFYTLSNSEVTISKQMNVK